MTKLTTELLEKFVNDIKTDGMCDITDHQVESALIRLLAYEQAAEKPYGYLEPCDFPRTTATVYPEKDKYAFMPLYAAPVLPKQPEPESIVCWSCKKTITLKQRAEADGFCPLCDAEIELEPAQPVIPEQRQRISDDDLVAVPRGVLACAGHAYGKAGLKDGKAYAQLKEYQFAPAINAQPVIPREWTLFNAVSFIAEYQPPSEEEAALFAWNACRAAMLKAQQNEPQNIPENIPTQPVSEPYNSPVIPDGWKLVPIEPTENMIIDGFESEPDESFSEPKDWEEYAAMSGCEQAAHRAKLCWAAMLAAAPTPQKGE